ncbi:hypothetical protein Tco_0520773 [Tanacetum coccineum]
MKDLVSPLTLAAKSKKGKSQTVTLTLPKSQGLEVPGALSKKSKKPKSKNPPIETKVTPPKLTKGSEQSHSVSLSTITNPQDLERNIQLASTGLPSTLDEGTRKAKPLLERTGAKYQVDQTQSTRLRYQSLPKNKGKPSHKGELDTQPIVLSTYADVRAFLLSDDESEEDILRAASDTDSSSDDILKKYDNTLPFTERQLVKYLSKMLKALFTRISKDNWEKQKEATVNYVDLKASIDDYYDENIAHRDQTDKLVEASMSSLDKSINTISDLYKGLNISTEILKDIKNAVKDDSAYALKQYEELAAWAKSFTNMAWNLGSRLSGQSSGCVTPTPAFTRILVNVEGENTTNTATEDPPFHTEGRLENQKCSQAALRIDKGKGITTESEEDSSKKLVPASTNEQIDKEELIKKAEEDAKILAISKPEVIKVVQDEAKKIGLDPKKIASAKAGEKFKKAQDAKHQVLKREHTEKVRKSLELRKHKFECYMWTINNRLKPETITDIKIHPKTKPVVITVYRGTDDRNFDVHIPFAFGAFGISELDELREIIPKKKNAVVHDLMNSISRRYERIRKIPEEHGIKSALPDPAPEQASFQSSRKKRKTHGT